MSLSEQVLYIMSSSDWLNTLIFSSKSDGWNSMLLTGFYFILAVNKGAVLFDGHADNNGHQCIRLQQWKHYWIPLPPHSSNWIHFIPREFRKWNKTRTGFYFRETSFIVKLFVKCFSFFLSLRHLQCCWTFLVHTN